MIQKKEFFMKNPQPVHGTMSNNQEHESYFIQNRYLRMLLPPSLLAILTALIYYPSLSYPFQFDDIANISKRYNIRFDNPLSRWWSSSRWFGDWLNSINYQIGGFEPFYYRMFNVIIHILAGLCVFYLVLSLCKFLEKKPFFSQNAHLLAFVSSGLFLLHPVQTQTISYVIQARLEGLASLFVLATLLAYVKAVEAKHIALRVFFIGAMFVSGLLACGTKELVIVLPVLLILIDWFFISQEEWSSFKKRAIVFGAFGIIFTVFMLHHVGLKFALDALMLKVSTGNNRGNILTDAAFDVITPWQFLISEFKVIIHYITMFVWPFNISVEYDWKIAAGFWRIDVVFPFIMLMTIVGSVLRWAWQKKNTMLTFGMLWFFFSIAPRATVLPSPELACDYKTYLASVGIMMILATGLVSAFSFIWTIIVKQIPSRIYIFEAQLGSLACLILMVGGLAYQRNLIWETSVAFWEDNAKKAPLKARVHNNLGVAYSETGKIDESIVAYQKAIAMDSYYADPLSNLAVAYSLKGDIDKAIDSLRAAIHICPNYPEAYNNLGTLLLQKKLYVEAEDALQVALQLRPYYGKAHYNLARMYEEKGDHEQSWACLKRATEGDLDTPEVFLKLGQMSLRIKKYNEAVESFERMIACGINDESTWFNLANSCFMAGQQDRAQMIFERLVEKNPLDARYAYNLAEAYFTKKDFDQAYVAFRRVTGLPQPIPQAFFRAAHCLEQMNKVDDAKTFLNELLALNAAEDFKAMVHSEIKRMSLQHELQQAVNAHDGKGIGLNEMNAILKNHQGDAKVVSNQQTAEDDKKVA